MLRALSHELPHLVRFIFKSPCYFFADVLLGHKLGCARRENKLPDFQTDSNTESKRDFIHWQIRPLRRPRRVPAAQRLAWFAARQFLNALVAN